MANKQGGDGPNWAGFRGYHSPNYTMVPDQLFDEHLAFLSGAELKVLLYIIRRTFGFKKDADSISISQMLAGIEKRDGSHLDHGVGLSKPTLLQALRSLVEKNLIASERQRSAERGDEPTIYWLRVAGTSPESGPSKVSLPPVVKKFDQGGGKESSPGPWPKNLTTQETVIQETAIQDLSSSNIRKRDLGEKSALATHNPEDLRTDGLVANDSTDLSSREMTTAPGGPRNGVASVGSILARRGAKRRAQGTLRGQKPYSDERQQLLAFIRDFATEFRDEAPLSSSVSRAYNLYTRSGIPLEAFCSFMYEARSLTQEYTSNIKKRRSGAPGAFGPELNKMPYFFSILEELAEKHAPATPAAEPEVVPVEEHSSLSVAASAEDRRAPTRRTSRAAQEATPAPSRTPRRPSRRGVTPSAAIASFITDLAEEKGERGVALEAVDQVQTVYAQSGLAEDGFLQVMQVAKMLTHGRQLKPDEEYMPHFSRVLREQLGLQE
jgi:Bacteriophage replication protein O